VDHRLVGPTPLQVSNPGVNLGVECGRRMHVSFTGVESRGWGTREGGRDLAILKELEGKKIRQICPIAIWCTKLDICRPYCICM